MYYTFPIRTFIKLKIKGNFILIKDIYEKPIANIPNCED